MLHTLQRNQDTFVVVVTVSHSRFSVIACRRPAQMAELLEIIVNGESHQVVPGTTVRGLIEQLGFGDRRVAVERNRQVVPRAEHDSTALETGDQLEIVTFVGGG